MKIEDDISKIKRIIFAVIKIRRRKAVSLRYRTWKPLMVVPTTLFLGGQWILWKHVSLTRIFWPHANEIRECIS